MSIIEIKPSAQIKTPTHAAHSDIGAIGPTLETTLAENLAIRRFLRFQLDDIKFQLQQLAKEPTQSRQSFEENKQAAQLLGTFLIGAIRSINDAIRCQDIDAKAARQIEEECDGGLYDPNMDE
jgi:hypothetical protein